METDTWALASSLCSFNNPLGGAGLALNFQAFGTLLVQLVDPTAADAWKGCTPKGFTNFLLSARPICVVSVSLVPARRAII